MGKCRNCVYWSKRTGSASVGGHTYSVGACHNRRGQTRGVSSCSEWEPLYDCGYHSIPIEDLERIVRKSVQEAFGECCKPEQPTDICGPFRVVYRGRYSGSIRACGPSTLEPDKYAVYGGNAATGITICEGNTLEEAQRVARTLNSIVDAWIKGNGD